MMYANRLLKHAGDGPYRYHGGGKPFPPGLRRTLLFSGGMDSVMAWRLLGEPRLQYIPIGHAYEGAELRQLEHLKHLCFVSQLPTMHVDVEPQGRLLLADVENTENAHVDLRNLMLGGVAVLSSDVIYLAAISGESGRDKAGRFLRLASKTYSFSEGRRIRFAAPFRSLTKSELVALYLRHFPTDDDRALLLASRSCYSNEVDGVEVKGCGACMACFRRWVAMSNNGIHENLLANPWEWQDVKASNWREFLNGYGAAWVQEWPAIAKNNYDAARAVLRARERA
jgi:7-cyano-7-deazaguanine synthase in queuosine biosynthesis